MYLLLLCTVFGSLHQEVSQFLAEYSFNGYTVQWNKGLYLAIGEPCTLWMFPNSNLEGVVCAAGGSTVLDISMELSGPDVDISDETRDDMPVIPFSTGDEPGLYRVTVTARDMLFGSTADSVYVFSSLREDKSSEGNSDPAPPE